MSKLWVAFGAGDEGVKAPQDIYGTEWHGHLRPSPADTCVVLDKRDKAPYVDQICMMYKLKCRARVPSSLTAPRES